MGFESVSRMITKLSHIIWLERSDIIQNMKQIVPGTRTALMNCSNLIGAPLLIKILVDTLLASKALNS
jgi:hypothetical protein